MALPSLSAAFGFPTPLHLTDGAGVSEGVTSYAASHCPFSQPTSSTLQLSPRPSNDGDFDHDVHSDCSSNSKSKLRRDEGRGRPRDGTLVVKLHCLPTGNGERSQEGRKGGREGGPLCSARIVLPVLCVCLMDSVIVSSVRCSLQHSVCPVNIEFGTVIFHCKFQAIKFYLGRTDGMRDAAVQRRNLVRGWAKFFRGY